MKVTILKLIWLAALGSVALTSGCGDVARTGRSPVQLVIDSVEAASGADDQDFGSFLLSDVETLIEDADGNLIPTFFNDVGQVTMRLVLRDPGAPGIPAAPSALNAVTITQYRIVFVRSDGRNAPGVDVPFPFVGGASFTVPSDGTATFGFNLVRHAAKLEAPLRALHDQLNFISTVAEITFFGHDQAGNDVSAVGKIQVEFGNFADPQ